MGKSNRKGYSYRKNPSTIDNFYFLDKARYDFKSFLMWLKSDIWRIVYHMEL